MKRKWIERKISKLCNVRAPFDTISFKAHLRDSKTDYLKTYHIIFHLVYPIIWWQNISFKAHLRDSKTDNLKTKIIIPFLPLLDTKYALWINVFSLYIVFRGIKVPQHFLIHAPPQPPPPPITSSLVNLQGTIYFFLPLPKK